ncbi:hypothetical protein BTA51_16645 [Hahella sp. CCB-MM4]|uniref:hypothetical protein n=1 Tax=Hahella sp. (strain CCB-MM4) TaxID=1926491 RepID=UPI000B9B2C08|nr:hypothetical protein [Hahella sp. CCB-MM4]OZG72358.1 hypothetical protein BTA51_16645 [Hahella sp. CCB-MM4]
MNLCKVLFFLTVSFFLGVSNAFSEGDGMGNLLLSSGNGYLFISNLADSSLKELAPLSRNGNVSGYINLEKVDQDKFLFESTSHAVGIFDIRTHQEDLLFENASCPIYFESSGNIIFSRVERTHDGFEESLYMSDLSASEPVKVAKLERGAASKCPIKISDSQAIFFESYGKNKKLKLLDIRNQSLRDIDLAQYEPVMGIGGNNLLCVKAGKYFVLDLKTNIVKEISEELLNRNNMFAVSYIEENNTVVIQEYRERLFLNAVVNVWLLEMDTLKKKLLVEGIGVAKKGALYFKR